MKKTHILKVLCSTLKTPEMSSKPFFQPFSEGINLEIENSLSEANQRFYESLK